MAAGLCTGSHFPWAQLCRHWNALGDDGRIAYVPFITRFHNPLSRRLADRWVTETLRAAAQRLGAGAAAEFDRLIFRGMEKSRNNGRRRSLGSERLSYEELRALIINPEDERETTTAGVRAQAAHTFAVFRCMDVGGTGFVMRHEFLSALSTAAAAPSRAAAKQSRAELGELWDATEGLIRTLCRGRVDARTLFRVASGGKEEQVTRRQFVKCIANLLRGGEREGAADCCGRRPMTQRRRKAEAAAAELWELLREERGIKGGGCMSPPTLKASDFSFFLTVIDGDMPELRSPISPRSQGGPGRTFA